MELDISAYCGKQLHCACGRTHFCDIDRVEIDKGALSRLPEILQDAQKIFLVADTNTWAVCGEAVAAYLKDWVNGKLVYEREGKLIPNEAAVAELNAAMPVDTDLVVGIGSGVINDICKFVTWKKKIPCAIVATAPSMDGYASSGAAMIWEGMKVTFTTHPPKYIVADTDIVKNAPMDMIQAGYGDIINKYSSLNDWRLANLLNGEYLCQPIYDLVMEVTDNIRDSAAAVVNREDKAITLLMKGLVLIGMTLSLVESTRPGSGSEHHLGHFFEVTGLIHGKGHFMHGTDVAYASILTAGMREQLCEAGPDFCMEPEQERLDAWERIYGPVKPEVEALQKTAGSYTRDRTAQYREKWQEITTILRECPTAAQMKSMMGAVGFDMDAFEAMYGDRRIRDAMFYGKDLKDRYSFLWIYYSVFSGRKETVTWRQFLQN